ncbi:MAG: hypothetical protein HUJ96_04465 [Marinilabiliaceae bacterium]|nr:hypothetical protein [Marinilabiliaceae bacterium]
MLKLTENSKIYIYCTAGVVTGGSELLHQLASFLRDNGRNSYMVYYGVDAHVVPEDYKCYNIVTSEEVEDNSNNVEVFIESQFDWINRNKNTQKFLWWLSVDNLYYSSGRYLSVYDYWRFDKKYALRILKGRLHQLIFQRKNVFKNTFSLKQLSQKHILTGYQSEYGHFFLKKEGFKELVGLKDYINDEYLSSFSTSNKEDIVVYNPRKGIEYTRKLIQLSPDIKWVPLQNMSRKELIETIRKAKVYIDFGNHPGKDRIPRECAASGCCVITGSRGSAAYFEDVPILGKYKFDECKASMHDIIKTIKETLRNYDTCIEDFEYYRRSISQEKQEFENQIRLIFAL